MKIIHVQESFSSFDFVIRANEMLSSACRLRQRLKIFIDALKTLLMLRRETRFFFSKLFIHPLKCFFPLNDIFRLCLLLSTFDGEIPSS